MKLAKWYERLIKSNIRTFATVARTLENHNFNIINYFENRSTNAAAESLNAKIKAFRALQRSDRYSIFLDQSEILVGEKSSVYLSCQKPDVIY